MIQYALNTNVRCPIVPVSGVGRLLRSILQ